MSLKEQVEADIKKAMLAKDKDALRALRGIKSLILLAETEKGGIDALDKDAEIKLLTKAVKQRRDSAEIYKQQGRADLEKAEVDELEIINKYLPKQLSEEEVKEKIKAIIERVGAKSAADMGKVMGVATKELAGMTDGKTISALTKTLLSN